MTGVRPFSASGGVGATNDNKKHAQAAAYYFSKALGLRPGSLYVNGKMVDLEGPTFNVFQVCILVVWFRCVVSALLGVGVFCWRRRNVGKARHRSPVKSNLLGGLTNSKSDCRERAPICTVYVLGAPRENPVKTPVKMIKHTQRSDCFVVLSSVWVGKPVPRVSRRCSALS